MRFYSLLTGVAAVLLPTALAAQPTAEQRAQIDARLETAYQIDPRTNEPAYREAFEETLEFAGGFYPSGHPELALIENQLAIADLNIGRFDEASVRLNRLLPVLEAAGADYLPDRLAIMNSLLVAYVRQGDLEQARAIGEDVLAQRRALLAAEPDNQDFISSLAASLNNSGFILNMDGKPLLAIEYMTQVEALIDRLDEPSPELLSYLGNTPTYWAETGDSDMALREGQRLTAKQELLLPENHPILANSYNSLSVRAAERGQLDEAERLSRRAIELVLNAETPDMAMASSIRLGLAQTLIKKSDPGAALRVVEEALVHMAQSYGEKGELTLYAQHVRAYALRDLGRLDEAIAVAEAADILRQETMLPAYSRRISGQEVLAELYLQAGRADKAYATQMAAQMARITGDSLALWEKLTGDIKLGAYGAHAGIGDLSVVEAAHGQLVARRDAIVASGEPDAVQLAILGEAYDWALDAAMQAGDGELAFRLAQDALATKADRVTQMAAFRQGLESSDAAGLRNFQDRGEALRLLSQSQLEQMSQGVEPQAMAAMSNQIADARAALASAARSLSTAAFPASQAIELAQAQAALSPDEALLIAQPLPTGLGVFVATRDNWAMHIAPLSSREVTHLATRMRGALTGGDDQMRGILANRAQDSLPGYDFAPGAALHSALFGGEAGALLKAVSHIRIAAGGALSRIPFAALAPQAASLDQADWLIRHHSLSTIASLSTLGNIRSAAPQRVARVVAVGAPVLGGESLSTLRSSRGLAQGAIVADLPPLPDALGELDAISRALGSSDSVLLVGNDASEDRVLAEISRPADVIAFATHGLLEGELNGLDEPALVLTPDAGQDGLLKASEIAMLDLDADWVILSACNTGGPDRPGAAGLSGLASAFLYAGARNLLVSHWEVADDVAQSLTVPTVESYYRDGIEPAEGLRRAVIALIDQSGDPRLQHPAYWGPFVYVGGS